MSLSKEGNFSSGSSNRVPTWDGRPESFFHYITEIKWHLAGTKASERPYAAARLVRRILESEYPSLKSLAYKLDPADFTSEDAVTKLIAFLEASPMNRQPIPDAGRQLSAYYRRLSRKPQETIPQFLVREETLYDSMWRALQRLLREKELDFEQYDCSLAELKEFCGMADRSFFIASEFDPESRHVGSQGSPGPRSGSTHPSRFGAPRDDSPEDDSEDLPRPPSSRTQSESGHTVPVGAAPPKPSKRLDLIERLMQKGLIPLAALDIIRGWLLLECASATELDKSLVKAATQNKLGYQNIRAALLSLHEDRGGRGPASSMPPKGFGRGKGYHANLAEDFDPEDLQFQDHWYDEQELFEQDHLHEDGFYADETHDVSEEPIPEGEEENPNSMNEEQALNVISQLQDEERELTVLMADAQRNLEQARRAVQEAKKDRGWKPSSRSKGSPPHGGQKGTSTFMQNHGPRMQSNYMQQKGFPYRGGKGMRPSSSPHWRPQQTRFAGQSYQSGRSFTPSINRPPASHSGMYMEPKGHHMMTVTEMIPEAEFSPEQPFFPMDKVDPNAIIRPEEAIIDSGATVSAGGETAVKNLLCSLAQARPDLSVTVVSEDRPYFRYGSGSWGRASYKVKLHFGDLILQIYALPSPGVPVLLGMREMQQLRMIVNTINGHAIVLDEKQILRMTSKRQILFSFLKDIPVRQHRQGVDLKKANPRTDVFRSHPNVASQSQQMMTLLDFVFEPNSEELPCFVVQESQIGGIFADTLHEHLCISPSQVKFLVSDPSSRSFSSDVNSKLPHSQDVGSSLQRRLGRDDPRSSAKGLDPASCSNRIPSQDRKEVQERSQDRVRQHSDYGNPISGSTGRSELLAMQRETQSQAVLQPIRSLARVSDMCLENGLHSSQRSFGPIGSHGLASECGVSHGAPENGRLCGGRCDQSLGQENDFLHRQPGTHQDQEGRERKEGTEDNPEWDSSRGAQPGKRRRRPHQGNKEASRLRCEQEESMIWENHQASSWNEGRGDDEMGDEMNEPTPNLILRELTENLNSSIFHIEQQLRSLQEHQFNLWELCCSPSSTLSGEAIRNGLKARRWTFEEGFDIEKPECVQEAISALKTDVPSKIWASLRCTPWTSNQDMSQRTPQQVANLRRMRLRARKQLRHVLKIFKTALSQDTGTDIYFEWPKYASEGWRLPELKEFEHWYNTTFEKPLYRTEIHGCMVGLVDGESKRIHKPWIILSTDQHFDCHAAVVCDGQHEHRRIFGMSAHAVAKTAFYSPQLAKRIIQVWKYELFSTSEPKILQSLHTMDNTQVTLHPADALQDLQTLESAYPVERKRPHSETIEDFEDLVGNDGVETNGQTGPSTGQSDSKEVPMVSEAERERGRALLHKLHKSAGHPSNRSLARLIRDRKLPGWLVDEAMRLQCTHCSEVLPGNQMILHRSLGEHPRPWQLVGMDVFELPFPKHDGKGEGGDPQREGGNEQKEQTTQEKSLAIAKASSAAEDLTTKAAKANSTSVHPRTISIVWVLFEFLYQHTV